MKKNAVYVIAFIVPLFLFAQSNKMPVAPSSPSNGLNPSSAIAKAFEQRQTNLQVEGQGIVKKILPDDIKGSKHQKFIVQIFNGQTLLLVHNIDLAPRVSDLSEGDQISFQGEYEWNPKGGLVHWTHHDPRGQHPGGWIKHKEKIYQ